MKSMRRWLQILVMLAGTVPSFGQLPSNHVKVIRANEILRRVGVVFGYNEGRRLPGLVMFPKQSSRRIAYLGTLNRLVIDERLYDVCERVDEGSGAALAFVMAHELAHLWHGHHARLSFAESAGTAQTIHLIKQQQASRQEEEADKTGLLYAYIAGFDPQPVLENLFDSLYAAYRLSDNLPGYPSKTARKSQTRLHAEMLRPVALLFWVGQTLYCRGDADHAALCYQQILTRDPETEQHYPLREVVNNLGVCRLKLALAASPNHPMRYFAMPFEIDPQNRLMLLDKRGQATSPSPLVDEWLRLADEDFGQAVALDRTYTMAHLNRATCALLRQNYHKAKGYLQDIREYTPERSLPATWWLIDALADYGLGEAGRAHMVMRKAKERSASQLTSKAGRHYAQLISYNGQTLGSLLKKPGLPPKLPQVLSADCQSAPTPLIDVNPPQNAVFSQTLLSKTTPDPYLKVLLAIVQKQPYIKVVLTTKREFVLTNSAALIKR